MIKKCVLSSGNVYYYKKGCSQLVSYGMIVSTKNEFLGGYICKEANRKFKTFSTLKNTTISVVDEMPSINNLDISKFCSWIGSAERLFSKGQNIMVSDYEFCSEGTSSISHACDERRFYFQSLGADELYNSKIKCPLWAIIANHVAIFGVAKFKETFFRGRDIDSCESDLSMNETTRYYSGSFKAPAFYLRAIVNHVM